MLFNSMWPPHTIWHYRTLQKKYLKESSMKTLYYAFIYPYFTYCITVWGNTFNSVLKPLIVLQKCAIRIVCGAQRFDHTYPLFQLSKILPLRNLYVYSAQLFLYKYHRQSLPNIFSGFFTINETIHNHYTQRTYLNEWYFTLVRWYTIIIYTW